MNPDTKDKLRSIVGEANFSDQLIDLVSYGSDASEHTHRPQAAAWATSAEQVQAIVQLANAEGFPVTVRGAGTGLAGLAVPAQGGLVLDMSRMDQILDISIGDRVAVVQPGVVYADLAKALEPHGYMFPARSVLGQGLHPGRQRGHQRRRGEGGQVRHHPGLRAGPHRGAG